MRHQLLCGSLLLFASLAPLSVHSAPPQSAHLPLLLVQQGQIEQALNAYVESCPTQFDLDLLRRMGLLILDKGAFDPDPQVVAMTLLGATIARSHTTLDILTRGISSPWPYIQLLALQLASGLQDDGVNTLLHQAMTSDFLPIRLEAARYLAERRSPRAFGQIESLMHRLPSLFRPYFPSLFAQLGTMEALEELKRLGDDPNRDTRIEAILQIAYAKRDDLLPWLRKKASHIHVGEKEAVLFALGELQDRTCQKKLIHETLASTPSVRLAALLALYKCGYPSALQEIHTMAEQGNLFAIASLQDLPGSEDCLANLMHSSSLGVRVNATLALLQRRDPRTVEGLVEILIRDERDLGFQPMFSLGRSQQAVKVIPSFSLIAGKDASEAYTLGLWKETILREALYLPEPLFLDLAKTVLEHHEPCLIREIVESLIQLQSPEAVTLLEQSAKAPLDPLLRAYANLALFRLYPDRNYRHEVQSWMMSEAKEPPALLPSIPTWGSVMAKEVASLSNEERSKLWSDSLMAIAQHKDVDNLSFLFQVTKQTTSPARYALVGLLVRSAE